MIIFSLAKHSSVAIDPRTTLRTIQNPQFTSLGWGMNAVGPPHIFWSTSIYFGSHATTEAFRAAALFIAEWIGVCESAGLRKPWRILKIWNWLKWFWIQLTKLTKPKPQPSKLIKIGHSWWSPVQLGANVEPCPYTHTTNKEALDLFILELTHVEASVVLPASCTGDIWSCWARKLENCTRPVRQSASLMRPRDVKVLCHWSLSLMSCEGISCLSILQHPYVYHHCPHLKKTIAILGGPSPIFRHTQVCFRFPWSVRSQPLQQHTSTLYSWLHSWLPHPKHASLDPGPAVLLQKRQKQQTNFERILACNVLYNRVCLYSTEYVQVYL